MLDATYTNADNPVALFLCWMSRPYRSWQWISSGASYVSCDGLRCYWANASFMALVRDNNTKQPDRPAAAEDIIPEAENDGPVQDQCRHNARGVGPALRLYWSNSAFDGISRIHIVWMSLESEMRNFLNVVKLCFLFRLHVKRTFDIKVTHCKNDKEKIMWNSHDLVKKSLSP